MFNRNALSFVFIGIIVLGLNKYWHYTQKHAPLVVKEIKDQIMIDSKQKLIIIGSGPAGLTAAVYAARANLHPLVIEGPTPGGQLMFTTTVENWPGLKSVQGPQLMMDMKDHAQHFGTQFLSESVISVDFTKKPFTLTTDRDKTFEAQTVIVASGATPKRLGAPGEDEYWGRGVTTCAVCDGAFYKDVPVIIVGGGDSAMEDALFMKNFTKDITIVHILEELTASHATRTPVLADPDITIIYNSTVTEILGDGQKITGVTVTNQKTKKTQHMPTNGVFVAIGYNPNTGPYKGQLKLSDYGYLQIENQTRTSIPGIFAAGDVFDLRYRQAITAAGSGCKAALDAEQYLSSLGKDSEE